MAAPDRLNIREPNQPLPVRLARRRAERRAMTVEHSPG